jgi:predicted acyl esterase
VEHLRINEVDARLTSTKLDQAHVARPAGTVQFRLPTVNHAFEPGHRIVVQVQSTLPGTTGRLSEGDDHDSPRRRHAERRAAFCRPVDQPAVVAK